MERVKGFSLVELLVTVAILAILAGIAYPNYQSYVEKARQTEAKTKLSRIFLIERSYFHESSTYTGCLKTIGYEYNAGEKAYYAVGFPQGLLISGWSAPIGITLAESAPAPVTAVNSCGPNGNQSCYAYQFNPSGVATTSCTIDIEDDGLCSAAENCFSNNASAYPNSFYSPYEFSMDCFGFYSSISRNTFQAMAIGHVSMTNELTWADAIAPTKKPGNDLWTINENKSLVNQHWALSHASYDQISPNKFATLDRTKSRSNWALKTGNPPVTRW
jgi:type IV pilus assembly protein PilE